MRTSSLVLLLALGLAACDSADAPRYPSDSRTGEATVVLGQTASLDGLAISFDAVETDSRCPSDVECVWEGEAIVALGMEGVSHTLRVTDPETRPEDGVRVGDRTVFAVALTPEPRLDPPAGGTPTVTLAAYPAP